MAWMVNVATIAARYSHKHFFPSYFYLKIGCITVTFDLHIVISVVQSWCRLKDLSSCICMSNLNTASAWEVVAYCLCALCLQSSVSGSSHPSSHRHVHLQRTFSGWRQIAAEGDREQRLQKQVSQNTGSALQLCSRQRTDTCPYCSMEVGVRAEAYHEEGPNRHINSAFMTFEVLDDGGKPRTLPRIRPEPLVS